MGEGAQRSQDAINAAYREQHGTVWKPGWRERGGRGGYGFQAVFAATLSLLWLLIALSPDEGDSGVLQFALSAVWAGLAAFNANRWRRART